MAGYESWWLRPGVEQGIISLEWTEKTWRGSLLMMKRPAPNA
jgi:hypothetical protein